MEPPDHVLDPEVVEVLRALQRPHGLNLLAHLTDAFFADGHERLARLRAAVAAGDFATVGRVANSLKGMCGAIGATRMASLCGELERKAGETSIDADLAARVETEFARVGAALRALL